MRNGFNGFQHGYNNLQPMMATWSPVIMIIKLAILIGLIVVAIIVLRKFCFSNRRAITILNERYAKGEIEEEEYLKKKQILRNKR